MARKRKRATSSSKNAEGDQRRQKIATKGESLTPSSRSSIIKQALLAQYYPQVSSLREYLLSELPTGSKVRRKKISCFGRRSDDEESDKELSQFLDHTLIGAAKCNAEQQEQRWQLRREIAQQEDDSILYCTNMSGDGLYSQSEVCIFVFSSCYCWCWEC